MRVSADEQKAFFKVLSQYIHEDAELRLFGSRADDNAKGGDIDLLLIVTSEKMVDELTYNKAKILSEIKAEIGDQIIDLYILSVSEKENDVFVKSVLPESVVLHYW